MRISTIERRLRRRALHRSRSTSAAVACVVVAAVAAWAGTESALRALGRPALLADPVDLVERAVRPSAATAPIVAGIAAALVLAGVVALVLAIAPGRRHRSPVAHDRGAVVVDDRVVATTAANAARRASGLPDAHVSASTRRRRTDVGIVPVSGCPVDETAVREAVRNRLGELDTTTSRRVHVRVRPEGTVS